MYPLLQFLEEREIYSPETLMQAKLELLKPTNMVDFAIDIHKELNQTEEVPAEMLTQRETVLGQLEKLQKEAEPMNEGKMNKSQDLELSGAGKRGVK